MVEVTLVLIALISKCVWRLIPSAGKPVVQVCMELGRIISPSQPSGQLVEEDRAQGTPLALATSSPIPVEVQPYLPDPDDSKAVKCSRFKEIGELSSVNTSEPLVCLNPPLQTEPCLNLTEGTKGPIYAPQWKDSVISAWRGLQERFPERTDFTFDEICDYTEENWQAIRGTCEKKNEWRASVRRVCTTTGVLVKSTRPEAPSNSWIIGDPRKAGPISKSGLKGIKAVRKRDFGDMSGSTNGKDGSRYQCSRQIDGRTGVSSLDTGEVESSSREVQCRDALDGTTIVVTEEAIARAAISTEWTVVPPGPVRLSERDRSPALTFLDGPEERMIVRGFKGFRMVRSTHGIMEGDWYFEATVMPFEGDGAVRLGWSTRRSDSETPVGFDGQSFGIRDRTGEFIHKAQLRKYGSPFGIGDIIGCRLRLPLIGEHLKERIAESDRRWLEHRFLNFLLGKAPPDAGYVHRDAFVEYFKNGTSFGIPDQMRSISDCQAPPHTDGSRSEHHGQPGNADTQPTTGVPAGMYFPSVALFRNAIVKVNFGPEFSFPCPRGCRPFSESASSSEIGCLDLSAPEGTTIARASASAPQVDAEIQSGEPLLQRALASGADESEGAIAIAPSVTERPLCPPGHSVEAMDLNQCDTLRNVVHESDILPRH
jgi:SPRY domain